MGVTQSRSGNRRAATRIWSARAVNEGRMPGRITARHIVMLDADLDEICEIDEPTLSPKTVTARGDNILRILRLLPGLGAHDPSEQEKTKLSDDLQRVIKTAQFEASKWERELERVLMMLILTN
ncbi:uncharacterized protein L3040_007824 [Drepanopeziza brunnea f. sp. 'multigermtubi']|uniref:uncharacterized protein n=1 Tax=Drepanopeziza brunnea f. sp. 'multigermtubi' TaxID=698441 RepID=UPI002389498A|nr:hypothetical protein L3040_007824 [Drepanopeziza brunnea f. sp. 'multigermtubi']